MTQDTEARDMAILGTCAGIRSRLLDLTIPAVARKHKRIEVTLIRSSMTRLSQAGYIQLTDKMASADWLYQVTPKGWEAAGVQKPMGVRG